MEKHMQEKLETLVRSGRIKAATDLLLEQGQGGGIEREAMAIALRYRNLKKKRLQGILSVHEDAITENQIISSLLDLIHHPEGEPFPSEESIDKRFPIRVIWWKVYVGLGALFGIIAGIFSLSDHFSLTPLPMNTVTVLAHGPRGKDDRVLPNRGIVTLIYGDAIVTEMINDDGEATFKQVSEKFFAEDARVEILFKDSRGKPGDSIVRPEPYRAVHHDSLYKLQKEETISLEVRRQGLDKVRGMVRDPTSGDPVANVRVSTPDQSTLTNAYGEFLINVPESIQKPFQTIRAYKTGYDSYEMKNVAILPDKEIPIPLTLKH